jgi:hypothetical protein
MNESAAWCKNGPVPHLPQLLHRGAFAGTQRWFYDPDISVLYGGTGLPGAATSGSDSDSCIDTTTTNRTDRFQAAAVSADCARLTPRLNNQP